MARKQTVQRKRRSKKKAKRQVSRAGIMAAFLLAFALLAAGFAWYKGRQWRPDEQLWPDQGAVVGERDGVVDFGTIAGLGAKFTYVLASHGAGRQDARFPANFAAARDAGLEVGAVHEFDPCVPADGQSANFVTVVPRDGDLLPPAILLEGDASDCPTRVSDAAVQSELMTLVNQIEAHSGKAVILAPSKDFEERYHVAQRIDRQLWLARNWFEPVYAGRPWMLWTANRTLQTEAAAKPLRWAVIRREDN
ncbi:glycoside hydrolase family 25 protein [Qipengyuania marisflavi]|uniref:Lysozyme n=1 Tax=Qipengyuania marisflavi TaxID=2486356 RepID=A0A5S3PUG6_9SPHN|nr:glycoside hydrolase family 25 protein [Qipengyuania marisflavi]TMM47169.1 lysozyme [Qipengyuania marisflavi]